MTCILNLTLGDEAGERQPDRLLIVDITITETDADGDGFFDDVTISIDPQAGFSTRQVAFFFDVAGSPIGPLLVQGATQQSDTTLEGGPGGTQTYDYAIDLNAANDTPTGAPEVFSLLNFDINLLENQEVALRAQAITAPAPNNVGSDSQKLRGQLGEGANPDIEIVKKTNGFDDTCPNILVGKDVTWTYYVTTGEGDVPIGNVVVTDDKGVTPIYVSGDVDQDGLLDLTETWLYSATGKAVEGKYENTGTATGMYQGTKVTDSEDDCYFGINPSVTIDKKISGFDDCFEVLGGKPITYTFTVENTGNVALTNLVVTDNVLGNIGSISSLAAGAKMILTREGYASMGAGEHENTATVTGSVSDDVGNSINLSESDEACYEVVIPTINIVKMTNGTDNECPQVETGSTVTWTYTVTSSANLTDVSVRDDAGTPGNPGDDFSPTLISGDDGDKMLEVGETWTYEAKGIAIEGKYENMATAKGTYTDALLNTTTPTDSESDCYVGECDDYPLIPNISNVVLYFQDSEYQGRVRDGFFTVKFDNYGDLAVDLDDEIDELLAYIDARHPGLDMTDFVGVAVKAGQSTTFYADDCNIDTDALPSPLTSFIVNNRIDVTYDYGVIA